MKFNSEDIWHGVPAVNLAKDASLPSEVFRFSLSDFVCRWKGFPSMNNLEKRNRLERIFNADYFDSHTVLTDAISLEKLIDTGFYDPSPKDGSGFIYIYTFEDNVLAGQFTQGMLWWETLCYETKMKIGRTEQNLLNRINQQLDMKTTVSEPPILLAAFWTNQVCICERTIHQQLASKRLTDSMGRTARGGVEWFKDIPTSVMPIIRYWAERYREDLSQYITTDNQTDGSNQLSREESEKIQLPRFSDYFEDDEEGKEESEKIQLPRFSDYFED
jgi:hypothetical protein